MKNKILQKKLDKYFIGYSEVKSIEILDNRDTIKIGLKKPKVFKEVYNVIDKLFSKNGYVLESDKSVELGFFKPNQFITYVRKNNC